MKRITCLECQEPKQEGDTHVEEHENCWWICNTCEDEIEEKMNCFNADVNYNLSTC